MSALLEYVGAISFRARAAAGRSAPFRARASGAALLALSMLPMPPAGAQAWVKVDDGVEYDPRSVRVAGDLRQVRVQVDLPVPATQVMSDPRLVMLYEIDCKEPRFRILSLVTTAKGGAWASKSDQPEPWTRITRVHESESMLRKAVCAAPTRA